MIPVHEATGTVIVLSTHKYIEYRIHWCITLTCNHTTCKKQNKIIKKLLFEHVFMHEGVRKKNIFWSKMKYLRCSTDELGMISELFSRRSFIKMLFHHFTILISRFSDHHMFSRKFSRNLSKIFGKLPDPHLFPVPTPHVIHPHPIP